MFSFIGTFLAGKGLKLAAIGIAAASVFGAGAYSGHRWQAGVVAAAEATAKDKVDKAEARTATMKAAKEQADANYLQLRKDVAAAMQAVQDRDAEITKEKESAKKLSDAGWNRRMDAVLDAAGRLSRASTSSGGQGRGGRVPQVRDPRCERDQAAVGVIAGRLLECDRAEAALNTILDDCVAQPSLCVIR